MGISMSFLAHLDLIHENDRKKFSIPQNNYTFRTYIPIKFHSQTGTVSFLIQKAALSKLLIIDGAQRVYLSDNDIINTILCMDDVDVRWFLDQLVQLYQGKGSSFEFTIEGRNYTYQGIENYPSAKNISLFSDTVIQIQDLVLILNFIFAKDYCWEHMPIPVNASKKVKSRKDFSKRTLCKYISLLDYYAWKSSRSLAFLQSIGYPTENEALTAVPKEEKMFQNTDLFDISLYL